MATAPSTSNGLLGKDAMLCVYPEMHTWPNVLRSPGLEKAVKLLEGLDKVLCLRDVQTSKITCRVLKQLRVLVDNYAHGNLCHGPMLAYGYVTGATFYTQLDTATGQSFLMPKHRNQPIEKYDCYHHVNVAIDGIKAVVRGHGCLDVECMDVRGSSILVPQADGFTDSNKAKIARFFGRCSMETPIEHCTLAYKAEDFLQQRDFQHLVAEALPRDESQFFLSDDEHVAFYAAANWKFFWAFMRDERGALIVNKIIGHRTHNGLFTPGDKPERLTVAFSRVDGRATTKNTSWMV